MSDSDGSGEDARRLSWWLEDQLRGARGSDLDGDRLARLLAEAETRGLDTSWPSIYRWASVSPTLARGAMCLPPLYVLEFLSGLFEQAKPKRMLDPWAAGGILLASLLHRGVAAAGVAVIRQQISGLEALLPSRAATDLVHGDPLAILDTDLGEFEAMVCVPPLGMKPALHALQSDDGPVELRADPAVLALIAGSRLLTSDGIGAAVVPWRVRQTLVAELPRFDFHVSALVALPPATRIGSAAVPLEIVVWSREVRESVFVGRLSAEAGNAALLDNLTARKPGDAPEIGRLVSPEDYVSFDRLVLDEEMRRSANESGGKIVGLGEVAIEMNLGKRSEDGGFESLPNAVYLPLIGESPVVTSISDLRIKPQNYVQVVLDPECALAEYAAGWLDSEIGRAVRRAATSGFIPKLSKGSLEHVLVVLPTVEVQAETVQAHRMILEVEQRLLDLRHGLWERPGAADAVREELRDQSESSFDSWVESLPFPIASILRRYEIDLTAEHRVEYLRRCFEATAQFTAIVLLSGFSSDSDYFSLNRAALIGAGYEAPETGTFGSWLLLVERLAKRARQMLNGSDDEVRDLCLDLFRADRRNLLDAICSKDLTRTLGIAKGYRDRWEGHGGTANEEECARRLVPLEAELVRLRRTLAEAFDGWTLVQPGGFELEHGVYVCEVECLTGSNIMFASRSVRLLSPMDKAHLYMLDLKADWPRPIRLVPLVRMTAVPRTEDRACYFYSRVLSAKASEIRWISHHFTPKPEDDTCDPDVLELVLSLGTAVKRTFGS